MTSESTLDSFCAMVWADDDLQDRLRAIRHNADFVEQVTATAREMGLQLDADELRDRMRNNALFLSISSVVL